MLDRLVGAHIHLSPKLPYESGLKPRMEQIIGRSPAPSVCFLTRPQATCRQSKESRAICFRLEAQRRWELGATSRPSESSWHKAWLTSSMTWSSPVAPEGQVWLLSSVHRSIDVIARSFSLWLERGQLSVRLAGPSPCDWCVRRCQLLLPAH
jgi:hypothetical protein